MASPTKAQAFLEAEGKLPPSVFYCSQDLAAYRTLGLRGKFGAEQVLIPPSTAWRLYGSPTQREERWGVRFPNIARQPALHAFGDGLGPWHASCKVRQTSRVVPAQPQPPRVGGGGFMAAVLVPIKGSRSLIL